MNPSTEAGASTAPARRAFPFQGSHLLELGPRQVDVWVAFIDEACAAVDRRTDLDVMSASEWAQHGKFVFEKDRRVYRVTRLLVRHALSRYAPIAPRDWTFGSTDFGRPFIANEDAAARSIRFSVSHCDKVVVLAVVHTLEVGIDVEDLGRAVALDAASSFLAADEVRQLGAIPGPSRTRRFLDFWTVKESYVKARGRGLSLPLDQFSFRLDREGELGFDVDPRLHDAARRWSFWTWQPSPDTVAALCLGLPAGTPVRIEMRRTIPLLSEEGIAFRPQRTCAA